jgi:cellulose synthase/poly-beta-1,6-N-acetylglucosamine synthase-like glycosyltransferase
MSIFFYLLFIYIAIGVVYFLFFAIAGKLSRSSGITEQSQFKKIAVVIPAYKEDQVILSTVQKALEHDYPAEKFEVFVMADQLNVSTLNALRELPLKVKEVVHTTSTKAKSLHSFFESEHGSSFDIVMVLDADNIMESGCLKRVNDAFFKGAQVVQCHRAAKNTNNALAILDAISEEIRINIFFRGHQALGLSAELIGSGMAFKYELLETILKNKKIQDSPGEDKEIFLQLVKQQISVVYLNDARVLDEKVSNLAVFKKQRTRWIESQLKIVKRFFDAEFNSIRTTCSFWYRLFQNLLLPRSFYLLLLPLFSLIAYVLELRSISLSPSSAYWFIITSLYWLSLLISVPTSYLNSKTVLALAQLPAVLITMVSASLQARLSNKIFVHTEKEYKNDE